MSEYDKNRDTRKKKFFSNLKDKEMGARPRPFFTSKETERPAERPPVILIKAREPSAAKEAEARAQSPRKPLPSDGEAPPPMQPTKIVHNENKEKKLQSETKAVAPPPPMPRPVKLIDESLELIPGAAEYLQDSNTDFLVVGVIGAQGVGKSTILNILAHGQDMSDICEKILRSHEDQEQINAEPNEKSVLKSVENHITSLSIKQSEKTGDGKGKEGTKPLVFKCQTMDQIERGQPCTVGVDMYVSSSRVILLDVSAAGGAGLTRPGVAGARSGGAGAGLEAATLLLTVCHVVIFVQDWFVDFNMLRFIQSAEMVKPTVPGTSNPPPVQDPSVPRVPRAYGEPKPFAEYHPHLLFLHNRCTMQDFAPESVRAVQELYRRAFANTQMQIASGLFMYAPNTDDSTERLDGMFHNLNAGRCGTPVNLFLMPTVPDDHDKLDAYRGHPSVPELAARLRRQVLGAEREALTGCVTNVLLTERSWLLYCAKAWDSIRKSTFFIEYGRLLP